MLVVSRNRDKQPFRYDHILKDFGVFIISGSNCGFQIRNSRERAKLTAIVHRQKAIRQRDVPQNISVGRILETSFEGDLSKVSQPEIQAVIYRPPGRAEWSTELSDAVESGRFQIDRAILQPITADELMSWLKGKIMGSLSPEVSNRFKAEMRYLMGLEQMLTGVSQFTVRIFTEAPTQRCGFHVDTIKPRATPVGLLKVFNGPGTFYVHPENVTNMADFYRYFGQRECLGKELEMERTAGTDKPVEEIVREIGFLDRASMFLHNPDDIFQVPEGATVAFKHLDPRHYWSDHPKNLAWIHCSPGDGPRRLVVNITACQ